MQLPDSESMDASTTKPSLNAWLSHMPVMLHVEQVSSKSDMGTPVVSLAEAQAMADQAGVPFITTSAKLNQNVTSLFQQIGLTIAALKGTAAKV